MINRIAVGVILFCSFIVHVAYADICAPGYWMDNDVCTQCKDGFYCPDGVEMLACPHNDTNDYAQMFGGTVIGKTSYSTYSYDGVHDSIETCYSSTGVRTSKADIHIQSYYRERVGTYTNTTPYWHNAAVGYYLSPYFVTTYKDWYSGAKPCTNKPDNAHYTGAGTPDEPVLNGATDYNDCPWECDLGYGLIDGQCHPLCEWATQICAGQSCYPVFRDVHSTPTIVLRIDAAHCFVVLRPGAATDGINIQVNGIIYHAEKQRGA